MEPHVSAILKAFDEGMGDTDIARKFFPERVDSARRNIGNLRRGRKDLHARYAAEKAMAKEIFAEEEKIAVDKEVAAIKKYKDHRERNDEAYKLAIDLFNKAIEKDNLNAAAMALAQVNAANAQIKPIATDATIQQTTNINMASANPFDKLEGYKKYFSDIEHDPDRKGAAGSDNTG